MDFPHNLGEIQQSNGMIGKNLHRKPKNQAERFVPPDKGLFYSARVTLPHRLGLVLIFWVPVQASWGMYSVPGQG